MLSMISRAVRAEKQELTALMTTQGRLASWQVWALREQRRDVLATLELLQRGDIVVKFRARPDDHRDVVMHSRSDIGRLNRFLDSVNAQLEGYESD